MMSMNYVTKKDIIFRPAEVPIDVEHIVKLWHDVYQETHAHLVPKELMKYRAMEQFRIRVANPEFVNETIVAIKVSNARQEDAEQLMGFITTRTANNEIYQLFVAKEARGSGIAKELLRRAEEYLKSHENKKTKCAKLHNLYSEQRDKNHVIIHLYASIGNYAAKGFYENNGWKTVKEEIFQAEVVRNERNNCEPQEKRSNVSPKTTYFPVPCYRLEKLLYLE